MKIIYEAHDLVMRSLILKKNTSKADDPNTIKPGDKMALWGWLVGFKTEKDDIYEGCALINVDLRDPRKVVGHRYVDTVSCEGGIPNIAEDKGYSLILGDEQSVNKRILARYTLIPEVIEREKQFEAEEDKQ